MDQYNNKILEAPKQYWKHSDTTRSFSYLPYTFIHRYIGKQKTPEVFASQTHFQE